MGAAVSQRDGGDDLLEGSISSIPDLPEGVLQRAVAAQDSAALKAGESTSTVASAGLYAEPATVPWVEQQRSVALLCLGLLLAPGLLLASWVLGPQCSSWAWMLALAAPMSAFCAWSALRKQEGSLPSTERRSTRVSGGWLASINFVILALLYTFQLVELPSPAPLLRLVLQNVAVLSELAVTLQASVRLSGRVGVTSYVLVVAHVLLLPFLDTQRMPFAFEGAWPRSFDHAAALVSLVLSPIIIWSPAVEIRMEPIKLVAQSRGTACLEHLQALCSSLCLMYLLLVAAEQAHVSWSVASHVLWSLLRAAMVALFALYWIEARSRPLQAMLSLLGLVFFLVFAPLVDAGSLGSSTPIPQIAFADLIAAGAESVEQLCFLLLPALFFMRGLGGAWHRAGVGRGYGLFALALFGTVGAFAVARAFSMPWVLKAADRHSLLRALLFHGGYGHAFVVLGTVALMETNLVEHLQFQRCWLELEDKNGATVLPK